MGAVGLARTLVYHGAAPSMRPPTAHPRILHRVLAICLMVAIALPVIAPFQTVDLIVTASEVAIASSPARDVLLAASPGFVPARPSPWTRFDVVPTRCGSDHCRILPAVLRV